MTKIGFDVSYGYMCSYGYSATTAIFDKRRINKFSNLPPVPVPSKNYSNEGTAAGINNFVSCRTGFTEEEDADENGWIAVILRIVQRHCVTKIGFDVIYGYICSYGYGATTAIIDK